jgi:hypothetical protein
MDNGAHWSKKKLVRVTFLLPFLSVDRTFLSTVDEGASKQKSSGENLKATNGRHEINQRLMMNEVVLIWQESKGN